MRLKWFTIPTTFSGCLWTLTLCRVRSVALSNLPLSSSHLENRRRDSYHTELLSGLNGTELLLGLNGTARHSSCPGPRAPHKGCSWPRICIRKEYTCPALNCTPFTPTTRTVSDPKITPLRWLPGWISCCPKGGFPSPWKTSQSWRIRCAQQVFYIHPWFHSENILCVSPCVLNTVPAAPNMPLPYYYMAHIKQDGGSWQIKYDICRVWSRFGGWTVLNEMRHLFYCQVDNFIFPACYIKFSILEILRALLMTPDLPAESLNLGSFVFQN